MFSGQLNEQICSHPSFHPPPSAFHVIHAKIELGRKIMTAVGTVSSPRERWIWHILTATFLVSMTKYPGNKQLKGGRVSFGSQFQGAQSIMVGKLCQCEQEAACWSYSIQSQ